ncbi:uncharacterized protein [Ambystoma mexicanum]|uniref:uncharacterized protein n=1 Tax=Ambystoma mexicanum TaxID=8296 RepID=UPI0037E794F0
MEGKPQATDIKCVPCDGNNMQCCLELLRFYPKGIQLKWSSGTGSLKDVPFEVHEMGEAAGFSIRSMCVINEEALTDPNYKIRVTWEHSSLDDPEYKEISVTDPAFPGRPDLQDILVPTLIHGKEVSLQCQVSGYFPKELKVEWLRMERGSDARLTTQGNAESTVWKQDITDCRHEPEIGHSCTAWLTFTPDLHRDQGSEIICRVSHPSLQRALEKTTGMLTVLVCKGREYSKAPDRLKDALKRKCPEEDDDPPAAKSSQRVGKSSVKVAEVNGERETPKQRQQTSSRVKKPLGASTAVAEQDALVEEIHAARTGGRRGDVSNARVALGDKEDALMTLVEKVLAQVVLQFKEEHGLGSNDLSSSGILHRDQKSK